MDDTLTEVLKYDLISDFATFSCNFATFTSCQNVDVCNCILRYGSRQFSSFWQNLSTFYREEHYRKRTFSHLILG